MQLKMIDTKYKTRKQDKWKPNKKKVIMIATFHLRNEDYSKIQNYLTFLKMNNLKKLYVFYSEYLIPQLVQLSQNEYNQENKYLLFYSKVTFL